MEDVVGALEALVGFDTTSERSNLPLIGWVQERLEAAGAVCRRLPDAGGDKAGLLARLGPERPGGVVLSGHTDCVPADADDWRTDPFRLVRDGERLHGRGTADMKGFLATALTVTERADPRALQRPLVLALSRDEELGALGGPDAVAALRDWELAPQAVIVGEPTSMYPVVAHKGVRAFRTTVRGVAAHSSQPGRGVNAVVAAARIVMFLDDLARTQRSTPGADVFDPPHTTFNTGVITGGSAVNIVPDRCELQWEYRPVPDDDSFRLRDEVESFVDEQVRPGLRGDGRAGEVDTTSTAVVPSLAPEPDGAAARLVAGLDGVEPGTRTVAFGTDGGHFQAAGWSTVVCGPGSIDQAHRPDEHVTLGQLHRSRAMVEAVLAHLGGT